MNLAVWNPVAFLGLLALGLWWDTHGKAFLIRQRARRYGTCGGCGREKDNCSCQSFDFTMEDDE